MIEWGGGNVDDFNERLAKCTSETERAEEIQKMLAEQGLTESGKAWQENNKSIVEANNAQAEYDKTTAELGKTIEPLTNRFTELKTQALQWFIDTGLPALQSAFDWLKDNIPTVTVFVVGLTTATIAQKIANLANKAALEGMTIAQYAAKVAQEGLNKAMKANAVGLIVTAITVLITTFMQLWKNCEGFRNFWIGLWEGLKNAAKAVADWFVQAFSAVGQFFSNLWVNFGEGAKNAWQSIKNTFANVAQFFGDIFRKAWQKVKDVFSVGGKIFDGIKDGIVASFKKVVNAIIRGINKVVKLPFEGLNKILDKLSGIEIAGLSPFSWLTWRAPVPKIPELATGGVVTKATAVVAGEDGAEAILPLDKNKGYLKAFAKEIAAEIGGNGVTINQTNNYKQAYTSPIEKYKAKQELFAAARLIKAGAI